MNRPKILKSEFWKKMNKQIEVPAGKAKKIILCTFFLMIQTCFVFINSEIISRQNVPFWYLKVIAYLKEQYAIYSIVIIVVLIMIIWSLTNRLYIEYFMIVGLSYLFGIINNILLVERKEFLSIQHFELIEEASNVKLSSLPTLFTRMNLFLLFIEIAFGIVMVHYLNRYEVKRILKGRIRVVLLICGTAFFILFTNRLNTFDSFYRARGILNAEKLGGVVYFAESLFENDVDDSNAEKEFEKIIYSEYVDDSNADFADVNKPNIIVIMSEAFWDIRNMYGIIEVEEDTYETFAKLQKQAVFGELAVNTYGGGTVTTEFEFLTGLNAFDLRGTNSYYSTYLNKEQGSIVSYLKKFGYSSVAIHPFEGSMWSRDLGYKNMGFDEFINLDGFDSPENYRNFVSDNSLTDKIIETYEKYGEKDETPFFCFAVSIANHVTELPSSGIVSADVYESNTDVNFGTLDIDDERKNEIEEYVNGIAHSTEALQKLMNYFRDKEDTVIVFFGDHAPYFAENILEMGNEDGLEAAYRTPYMIWSNYTADRKEYGNFNSSYLSAVLVDYLDFPKSKQCIYNDYMRNLYPINTIYEIYACDGTDIRKKLESREIDEETGEYIECSKQEAIFANWVLKEGIDKVNTWEIP